MCREQLYNKTIPPWNIVSVWVWLYTGFSKECQQARFSLYIAVTKTYYSGWLTKCFVLQRGGFGRGRGQQPQ